MKLRPLRGGVSFGKVDLGFDRNLEDASFAFAKNAVGFDDVAQAIAMRDERSRVEPARLNERHEPAHAFFSAGAEGGDDVVVANAGGEGFVGDLQLARIDTEARERS